MSDNASDATATRGELRRDDGVTRPVLAALRRATVASVVAVAITGCGRGPNTAPVRGALTLDGQPLAGAAVLFMPVAGGVPGRASTKDDGSFSLTTFKDQDGALVGRHLVAVSKVETKGVAATSDGLTGKLDGRQIRSVWLTPERYGTPATSGLEATVEPGRNNVFEFRLTSD